MIIEGRTDDPAIAWFIGAVTQELITLEPAFGDRQNTTADDMFNVYCDIIDGKEPNPIEDSAGSEDLLLFVQQTLSRESERPALLDVIQIAEEKTDEIELMESPDDEEEAFCYHDYCNQIVE